MFEKSAVRVCALALVSVFATAGCANSLQFNFKPQTVKLPSAPEGNALVLGQAYMRHAGDWVQLFVTAVDDTKTWSLMTVRPDLHLLVPAGKRTFKVKVQIGNFLASQETVGMPQVSAVLQPGMVYQLNVREGTDVRGQRGVDLWAEQIGTLAQYEAYAREHPGARGRPVTHL